jgi:ABC-type sugar transport system ATPase subunit
VEPIGNETIVAARTASDDVVARAAADTPLAAGDAVWFTVDPARALYFDADSGTRLM